MTASPSNRPDSDLSAVLEGVRHWAGRYLDNASPAQVAEVLAVSAFLVGLNMGWANPAQAAGLLRETAQQAPSVGDYTRTLADALAGLNAGAAADHRGRLRGLLSIEPAAVAILPPFLLN
jgi:hypothetical protein